MMTSDGHRARNDKAFDAFVANEQEYLRWQMDKVTLVRRVLTRFAGGGTLADVGCFTGNATAIYLSVGFGKAVGFDASRQALDVAGSRGIEPRLWEAGAALCPADDGEFDVVIAADIIEHIVDTDQFIDELRRITRAQGHLIVTTPNLGFWISRLRLLRGKVPWSYPGSSPTVQSDLMVDLNHIRITTRSEWSALFLAHGLQIEQVAGWSLLGAMGNHVGMRARRAVDRFLTRNPDLAQGLLFVLRRT